MEAVPELTILCVRGQAAHERLRRAQERYAAAMIAADAARSELWDAERGLTATNRVIREAGYHDTGHMRDELQRANTQT